LDSHINQCTPGGVTTLIYVKCGNQDCGKEFRADTADPVWKCPHCGREIENRYYPFLTAKLMQAKINGDEKTWRERYESLIEESRLKILERYERIVEKKGEGYYVPDMSFLEEAEEILDKDDDEVDWKEEHDALLRKARKVVLEEDEILGE